MRTHAYSAHTETCEHCPICPGNPLICWERIVRTDKQGNTSVELRRVRQVEPHL